MPNIGRDILIVASWFPSIVDPVAGRFVADQASALVATGCRVRVVSFDPADLFGSSSFRGRLAQNVEYISRKPLANSDLVFRSNGSHSDPGIQVARLPIPNGKTPLNPVLHGERSRSGALQWLAGRWADGRVDLDGFRPTLIHAHTGYPDGAAAATLAKTLGVPLVITEHATFLARQLAIPEVRSAYERGAAQASALIAVSNVFAAEIRDALPDFADRVRVIANTVDVTSFQLARSGERRSGELLFVGYWKEVKGIDVLLRALKIIRATREDVGLRLVGESGDRALDVRWHALASELGVADAVSWEPSMDRSGVADAMRRADVFVHASRRETFGVVAAEALAAGLPIVASDSGGVPEIVGGAADGLGLIVPKDDPTAFATAVLEVLGRRDTFDQAHLRASVVDRFGSAAVAKRLMALYDAVLEERPGRGEVRPGIAGRSPGSGSANGSEPPQGTHRVHPTSTPTARPIVVVAFDPDRAQFLQTLRPEARAELVLVTSRSSKHPNVAGYRAVVLASLHDRVRALADAEAIGRRSTGWRRVVRVIRHPLAVARRRGVLPGLEAAITGPGTAAVTEALAGLLETDSNTPLLVCADGVDYLAARSVIAAGLAEPAPGGLRWLGDHLARG